MLLLKRRWTYWIRLLGIGLTGGIAAGSHRHRDHLYRHDLPSIPQRVGDPPQASNGIEYQAVRLYNTQDDLHLAGWYAPSKNGAAIILLHGYGNNRVEMKKRADVLAGQGYGVLLYDLRGHGESEGNVRAFGWQDVEDVRAALGFLSTRGEVDAERIGILGFSIGGQIAIRASAETNQIKAIIADDPAFVSVDDVPAPSNFIERFWYFVSWVDRRGSLLWTGIPIPEGVPETLKKISPKPILFIDTGESGGRALVRYFYEIASEPKELWEIPETFHGGQFDARPQEYAERMIAFFDGALLK